MPQKSRRPFKGNAPPGIFQTVDLSAGSGRYALGRAIKFPQRKYAAVDLELHQKGLHASELPQLKKHHVEIGTHNIAFMHAMQREGTRTRHLNMHLPEVGEEGMRMVNEMLKLAPKVLLPNGKIFIASVDKAFLSNVGKFAQREGMRWSWRPTLPPHGYGRESEWSEGLAHDPVYRITITCRPNAEQIKAKKEAALRKRFKF